MKKGLLILLWSSCFTSYAQLRLVKNHDGTTSSKALPRVVFNNRLVYTATEASINYPFFTDGTTDNSTNITDATSGLVATTTGTAFSYAILNGEVHFLANYTSTTGSFSRITKAGFNTTVCQAYGNLSTFTGVALSQMSKQVVLNTKILFVPNTVASNNTTGIEVYQSNGSAISLVKDINPTANTSSQPAELTVLNAACFFTANDGSGKKLLKTDGTLTGTVPYIDLNTNTTIANPSGLAVFGTDLVYAASPNQVTGNELYKTDGAGNVTLIKDMRTTALASSNPQGMTALGNWVYFSADNGVTGRELWRTNGTNAGTQLIKDINANGGGGGQPTLNSNPSDFMQVGTTVYFTANDGLHGTELWKTSGSDFGTVMVKDITLGTDSTLISDMTEYNGKLYFTASNVIDFQTHLWVTDGTAAGTTKITINPTGNSDVSNLLVYNNDLYFGADQGTGMGKELYAFHTTSLGTEPFATVENKVLLFPNPAYEGFEVQSTDPIQNVEIYSLQGQRVKTFGKQPYYDVADLAKGVYLVKCVGTTTHYQKWSKE